MSQEDDAPFSILPKEQLDLEIQKHARQRWWHEDHLVNQRTTWLLTTQAVLGAAYGYVQNRIAEIHAGILYIPQDKVEAYLHALSQFSLGLLFLGFLSGIFLPLVSTLRAWLSAVFRSNTPPLCLALAKARLSGGTGQLGQLRFCAVWHGFLPLSLLATRVRVR
jgi:hypothetical protein